MEQKARDWQRDWELYPDSIPVQTRNNNKKRKPTTQHKKARWGVCCRCAHAAPGYDETPFFCAHCNETSTPCPLVQLYGASVIGQSSVIDHQSVIGQSSVISQSCVTSEAWPSSCQLVPHAIW